MTSATSTYADGTAYVIVVVNSDADLNEGDRISLKEKVLGRSLRIQEGPDMVRMATVAEDGKPSGFVAGGRCPGDATRQELLKVAVSLSFH